MLSRAIQLMNKVYIISPYDLFICFDSGLPYWYNGVHVSALDNVSRTCMMHDPDTILILDLIVKFIRFLTCLRVWSVTFFCFNIGIIIFGNRVYHHEALCLVHSWSQYNVDFWPQSQIYRVLTCQTISIWVNPCGRMCRIHLWHRYYLDLWLNIIILYQKFASGQDSLYSLHWHRHTEFDTMRQHVMYIHDLWVAWIYLVNFRLSFYLVWTGGDMVRHK